jgi:phosphatidylglycerol:prolipoprotein diacylglycerol transferase
MIPYIALPVVSIGSQTITFFEIFVTIGLFMGMRSAMKMAARLGLSSQVIYDVTMVAIVSGFLGAHFFHGAFYERPFAWHQIFLTYQGLSSMGGFLGGTLGVMLFLRHRGVAIAPYANPIVWGVTVGQFWGRLGCFSVHDHPGKLSDFFLAVNFPGGARHDLGFYEALFLGIWLLVYFRQYPVMRSPWRYTSHLLMAYGLFRLIFGFLRAQDVTQADMRYAALTPAQWMACLVVMVGAGLWWKSHQLGAFPSHGSSQDESLNKR